MANSSLNYTTPEGDLVIVEIHTDLWEGNWFVIGGIVISADGSSQRFRHNLKFARNGLQINAETLRAFQDYARDLILIGNWRIPWDGNPVDWGSIGITTWEKMAAMGFGRNDALIYNRSERALDKENFLARKLVLERLYHSNLAQQTIRSDEFSFPADAIVMAIEDLNDLKQIEIIAQQPRDGEYSVRITAHGKQHYLEKLSTTRKCVFIILDCDERFKQIENIYRAAIGEDFEGIIQERIETKKDTILADIEQNIRRAAFVIADITGKGIDIGERFNPNCVFEAGLAKAMEKKIIYCVEDGMVRYSGKRILPFDFQNLQFSFWDVSNLEQFEAVIKERIIAAQRDLGLL